MPAPTASFCFLNLRQNSVAGVRTSFWERRRW